jgi:hypothetical protein
MNGLGTTMLGEVRDPILSPAHFSMCWLTVLFVPIVPLGIYLVERPTDRTYRFHGSIEAREFAKLYPGKAAPLVLAAFVLGALQLAFVIGMVLLLGMLFHSRRR